MDYLNVSGNKIFFFLGGGGGGGGGLSRVNLGLCVHPHFQSYF